MKVICQTCQYYARPRLWKRRNKDTGFCVRFQYNNHAGLVHKDVFCQWWTKREEKK